MTKFFTSSLKSSLVAAMLLASPLLSADSPKTAKVPNDKIFIGAGVGLGGYGMFGLEASVGYIHYFPKDTFIADKFRQGIRAYGSVGFSHNSTSYARYNWSYNYVPIIVGADYLLDFNPGEKYVWGIFAGLGVGFLYTSTTYEYTKTSSSAYGVGYAARAGGSLTIDNAHRLDLDFGFGVSNLTLRYAYLF